MTLGFWNHLTKLVFGGVAALLLVGCGGGGGGSTADDGGGGGGEDNQNSDRAFDSLYQDLVLLTREGHQVTGIFVDQETGYFVAPEYRTASTIEPVLSGAIFGVGDQAAHLVLDRDGLPESITYKEGERLVLSEYRTDSVTATFYSAEGSVLVSEAIQLDGDRLNELRSALADLALRVDPLVWPSDGGVLVTSAAAGSTGNLSTLSLGLNIISCGLAAKAAFATWGFAIPVAVASCGNLLLKNLETSYGLEVPAIVSTPLDIVGCASAVVLVEGSGAFDCAALLADHMRRTQESFSTVSIAIDGSGHGQVSIPWGVTCSSDQGSCVERFSDQMTVDVEAWASSGSRFVTWGGDCQGFSPVCQLTTSSNRTIRATFDTAPSVRTYSLGIQREGSGAGSVRSNLPGIDCGLKCAAPFAEGSTVTLGAVPALGSSFMGWGGACAGTGQCTVVMSQGRTIAAQFQVTPSQAPPPTGDVAPPPEQDPPPPIKGGPLNDTGITGSGNATLGNAFTCNPAHPAGQDCHHGRDARAVAGTLTKVGGGDAGFDFTKIANNGSELPVWAARGRGPLDMPDDWACTRDNVTGLVWEVKVNYGPHLRQPGHTYSWYDPNSPDGNPGYQNGGSCTGSACDTTGFVRAVNAQGLCGYSDWRMPTWQELQGLVHYDKVVHLIDIAYFPDTLAGLYWSGSPYAFDSNFAWGVNFNDGVVFNYDRSKLPRVEQRNLLRVRLVRGGQ